MTETTTIRIPLATKERLLAHRDGDQSIGDIVTWLAGMPTNTENTRARAKILAYLRSYVIRDFGDRDEATAGEKLWQELHELQYPGGQAANAPTAAILDHTALAKLATGHRLLARLVYTQPSHDKRRVFAPTQAIYTASTQHDGVQLHVKRLDAISECDFDLDAALTVGQRVPSNVTPAVAHVVHEAQPSMEWPTGRPVITTVPQMYAPYRLQLRPLPDND